MKTLSVSSVKIPSKQEIGKKFHGKLASMQNSFDYMKTHYGLEFYFRNRTDFFLDKRAKSELKSELFFASDTGDAIIIKDDEDEAETARKIYVVASRELRPEDQKSGYESEGVKPQYIYHTLDSTFNMFRGLLEYYAKKHEDEGVTFYVYGFPAKGHLHIECKNKLNKKESVDIYADNTDEGYAKIHEMVAKILNQKLAPVRNSLDYMTKRFGMNFRIHEMPDSEEVWVIPNIAVPAIINKYMDDADVVKEVYEASSLALKNENQKFGYKSNGVIMKKTYNPSVDSAFKKYKGLLEYYTKKHKGMKFKVYIKEDEAKLTFVCKNKLKKESVDIHAYETEDGYAKIHEMVSNVIKGGKS